jgi:hypothetical protein
MGEADELAGLPTSLLYPNSIEQAAGRNEASASAA